MLLPRALSSPVRLTRTGRGQLLRPVGASAVLMLGAGVLWPPEAAAQPQPGCVASGATTTLCTGYTSTTYTVPDNATSVSFTLVGAGGGGGGGTTTLGGASGEGAGAGGTLRCTVTGLAGRTLNVTAAGPGHPGYRGPGGPAGPGGGGDDVGANGFGGSSGARNGGGGGGGGGGASNVRLGTYGTEFTAVAAGGGGGAGINRLPFFGLSGSGGSAPVVASSALGLSALGGNTLLDFATSDPPAGGAADCGASGAFAVTSKTSTTGGDPDGLTGGTASGVPASCGTANGRGGNGGSPTDPHGTTGEPGCVVITYSTT